MYSSIKLKYVTAVIICAYFNLSCAAERVGASAKNTLNVLYQRFTLLWDTPICKPGMFECIKGDFFSWPWEV